jgi:hypothetical protein
MADLTLSQADDYVLTALRDRDGDSYDSSDRLNAINLCVYEFCRISKWLRKKATITLAQDSNSFDMTDSAVNDQADTDDFTADRIVSVRLSSTYEVIRIRDSETLIRKIWKAGVPYAREKPEMIAFETRTEGLVYPAPSAAISATFIYRPEHRSLTGDGDVIDVPRDTILPALFWGVPAILRYAGREELAASPMWRSFVEHAVSARALAADPGDVGLDIEQESFL